MINIGSGMIPRLKTREIAGLLMIALLINMIQLVATGTFKKEK